MSIAPDEERENELKFTLAMFRVERAQRLIDAEPARHWTVGEMAASCGLSRHYFSRLFNRTARCPLQAYVNCRRIEYSKKILIATDISIKEAAVRCGFSTMSHFCRTFKAIEFTTPTQFRMGQLSRSPAYEHNGALNNTNRTRIAIDAVSNVGHN